MATFSSNNDATISNPTPCVAHCNDACPTTSIEDYLAEHGTLVYRVRGTSMMPLLRQDKDLAVIEAKGARRCSVGDVVLSHVSVNRYVLHRVIKVTPTGYVTRGDNCERADAPVNEDQVIGVMVGYNRAGHEHAITERGYTTYARGIRMIHPGVSLAKKACRAAGKAKRMISRRKNTRP